MIAKYGKAITAALFFVWTVVAPLLTGDNRIDGLEWLVVGTGAGNALLTYIVPLDKKLESGKTVILAVLAALAAGQTVLGDGFQPDDLTIILGAGLAILIGWYAPAISNEGTSQEVQVDTGFTS